ncbi:hypothetical protein COW36_22595 [bacterium (Candidatus Blackallbacteria) CG17_big_fil_post_rev_8_21_14_2_50_48_46]|uniref:Uncharacterized protein n=1 Tax=bacterium (Candidatus Blackallbacteria) CG17_big_fil_post_rev_8_21_14_2_50_48_46 TaxID=2014261 RepID=A0A2M7FY78_9BACT|nr:MAG: hypothetical protein COW64_07365 [bacterium (Candidatus Blackallbacteria) CG18_big_fil_WC_8_21_14_2_50_49_26]PIW14169.1 MAG: hypothetical protein COW36_22595 [bacterium (Candidatus Blackallbacteria) CG17_big_fil_post_rev_8_21_14_2_50_48_46]PIW46710.1 MAG: hypothetical protein COW20_14870 [bacterium (Candidatus Blackallbacteria) CG13_big_fil_rev_8_21_14_2_50_49_14]
MALESENSVPKIVGGFNIPKAVIENKVDVLSFLEILVRKNLVTAQELDDVRSAVVEHLNAAYPDLQLSVSNGSPIPPPAKPMSQAFVSAPPPVIQPMAAPAAPTVAPAAPAASSPTPIAGGAPTPPANLSPTPSSPTPGGSGAKPLYVQAQPPKFIK